MHFHLFFSDLYPYLEFACLNGTRSQSKRSVAAISAIAGVSLQPTFSELYSVYPPASEFAHILFFSLLCNFSLESW